MIALSVQSVPCVALRRGHGARSGFSLLELILALAILALSVAAISQLVRLGLSHARFARELTKAELYCESTMAELVAGVLPLEGVTDVPIEQDSGWLYSVTVEPAAVDGLLIVTVTVYQAEPDPVRPIEFTLVRWLADPEVFSAEPAAALSLGRSSPSSSHGIFRSPGVAHTGQSDSRCPCDRLHRLTKMHTCWDPGDEDAAVPTPPA